MRRSEAPWAVGSEQLCLPHGDPGGAFQAIGGALVGASPIVFCTGADK
jgi:hypothetical protein